MVLFVGKPAPDFNTLAIMPDNKFEPEFNLTKYLGGYMGVLFFYSMDFSYVCPTEIIAIQNRIKEFNARKTRPVVVSVDSHIAHLKWKKTRREEGGVDKLDFPLVSDITRRISKGYDVLVNESMALRGTFIIDKDGIVRYQGVYDLPIGRNIDEVLRVIDGLQHYQKTGQVIPAGWRKGDPAVTPGEESLSKFLVANQGAL